MYHLRKINATLCESAKHIQPIMPPGGDILTSLPMSDAFNYRLLETWTRNGLKCEVWQLEMYNRHPLS